MNTITNAVAFITGGSSGIGKACALALHEAGAKVFVVGRNAAKLATLEECCPAISTAVCDIADEQAVAAAVAACTDRFGAITILINNAGVGIPTPDLATADIGALQQQLDTNIRGTFLVTRACLPAMQAAGMGHIINVVSNAGKNSNPTAPLYCTSKYGQRGFSSGLADQVLKLGIKVTDLNPAATDSDYWGERQVPREKFLKPEDVAAAALFILQTPKHVLIRELDLESMNMAQ